MKLMRKIRPVIVIILLPVLMLTACSYQSARSDDSNVLNQAEAQATAIIEQAQATALVLQAQTQATQVMAEALNPGQASKPEPTRSISLPTAAAENTAEDPTPTLSVGEQPVQEIKIMSVGFAGEGGLIIVRFLAPPEEAEKWWQGSVVVIDEANGSEYNEIPVMPRIGPLIGRPKRDGQSGYVMLINTPPGLQSGAMVTVTLGKYRFEHIPVQ